MAVIGVIIGTTLSLASMIATFRGVGTMITMRLVKDLGLLERVSFTRNSSEERRGGEEVERLHRRRF